MKTKIFSFMRFNRFEFGDQIVSQFVFFECKWLFSIILFYFHPSDSSQDRFHTHAFNALSFKLFGEYTEYVLEDEKTGQYSTRQRVETFQYFPRNSYHKIGNSTGCCTILLSGRWKPTWKEYINGTIKHYTWGRNGNNNI